MVAEERETAVALILANAAVCMRTRTLEAPSSFVEFACRRDPDGTHGKTHQRFNNFSRSSRDGWKPRFS